MPRTATAARPVAFHLRNLVLRHMPSRMLANDFRRSVQSEIFAAQKDGQ